MIFIILAVVAVIVAVCVAVYLKRLRYGNLTLVSGGVKTGKTELCVALCLKQYRKQLRKWRKACRKARKRYEPLPEKPLLYSNMPIGKNGFEYAPLTLDLITRKKRFRYGSVVYFNEVSFIAGSKDIKDEQLNDALLQLFKLCAHETKGGYFFFLLLLISGHPITSRYALHSKAQFVHLLLHLPPSYLAFYFPALDA